RPGHRPGSSPLGRGRAQARERAKRNPHHNPHQTDSHSHNALPNQSTSGAMLIDEAGDLFRRIEGNIQRPHQHLITLVDLRVGNKILEVPSWISCAASGGRLRYPDLVLWAKHLDISHPLADSVVPRFSKAVA